MCLDTPLAASFESSGAKNRIFVPKSRGSANRPTQINVSAIVFWLVFVLCYLFLSHVLSVATQGRYRLGIAVVALSFLSVLCYGTLAKNTPLIIALLAMCGVVLLSGLVNHSSLPLIGSFIRIPLTVYLIYHLVRRFLNCEAHAEKVLRYMYTLAIFQLPVIALQRFAYPRLPSSLKFSPLQEQTSLMDFGIGSFTSDADMSFCLVSLLVLLLFDTRIQTIVKRKWPMATWLTATVLFANSQIQYATVITVWCVYLVSHLRLKTLIASSVLVAVLVGLLAILFQTGAMVTNPLEHTLEGLSRYSAMLEGNVSMNAFFRGRHDRSAAIYYYLNYEPIKWLGDGPGSCYNTITRERSLGCWGHIFTFYPEVGLLGWWISILIFFVIAFPMRIRRSTVKLRISWVRALMFLSVNVLSFSKYPMNNSSMLFTYCTILIGYEILFTGPQEISLGTEQTGGSVNERVH